MAIRSTVPVAVASELGRITRTEVDAAKVIVAPKATQAIGNCVPGRPDTAGGAMNSAG